MLSASRTPLCIDRSLPWIFCVAACVCSPTFYSPALCHEGPDPVLRYRFDAEAISPTADKVKARLGPEAKVVGKARFLDASEEGNLFLPGGKCGVAVAENFKDADWQPPQDLLTVSFWGSVDASQRWGGLVSLVQDNGSQEAGWVLGYNNRVFTFGLASEEGQGRLTYLEGQTQYELGRTYHVAAVYDGRVMRLYVNGKLDASSEAQTGPIRYPSRAPLMLGAYRDADEFHGHRGRLREVAIYAAAATSEWVHQEFAHHAKLTQAPAAPIYDPLAFAIEPYLQFGTQTSMTVMWKTNRPSSSTVLWGEDAKCGQRLEGNQEGNVVHELQLSDLKPETQYFYRIQSEAGGKTIQSEVSTFQTAVRPETPFAFAVISDTQGNPEVSGKLANFAWGQRPNFLLHPGDLVSTGPNDDHWTQHFFPSMNPLIRYVPFYPVLGNHEQNAKNYFDYVSLPAPEYYYSFHFGNTQFFMIDSNRNIGPDSEQYQWLEQQLASSSATWKFVCHHHPPYSSDENDYGNLWQTNKGTRGDLRARGLVKLYEAHNVDFVWNGHIHSYERTWPILNDSASNQGPIYMITGGGGGSLETPGPIRPFFQNTVRRGHHYAMVRINGQQLEIQAYDIDNRLFDSLQITKKARNQ